MHKVVIPLLQIGVLNLIKFLHLPVAHVHLLQSVIQGGRGKSAILRQASGTCERRGIDMVKYLSLQVVLCDGRLLLKGVG